MGQIPIHEFRLALNSAVHETTVVSPAELHFSRKLCSPLDRLLRDENLSPDSAGYDVVHHIKDLQKKAHINSNGGHRYTVRNSKWKILFLEIAQKEWLTQNGNFSCLWLFRLFFELLQKQVNPWLVNVHLFKCAVGTGVSWLNWIFSLYSFCCLPAVNSE